MKQKGFTPILISVLIALGFLGYLGYKNYWPKSQNPVSSPTPSATPTATAKCVEKSSLNCTEIAELTFECTEEYQNWARANCPGWKEGQFCGGIAGVVCPEGYDCEYDGNYPDTSGVCIK